jgi:hypothetical protein
LTHPTAIHRFEDNKAIEHDKGVEEAQHGGTVEGVADADTAAPNWAAIQDGYEQAKANIVDPFPDTEKIDVRAVQPPAPTGSLPGTEAMSVAARSLAELLVVEGAASPARGPAPATASPVASHRRRGWWRRIRSTMHGILPEEGRGH